MAKISDMLPAASLQGDEALPLVQDAANRSAPVSQLVNMALRRVIDGAFPPRAWHLPQTLTVDDITSSAATGALVLTPDRVTIPAGVRWYMNLAIGDLAIAAGDTIRIAYELFEGAPAWPLVRFFNGAAEVGNAAFALSDALFQAQTAVPANTTHVRFDYTNVSGAQSIISRPAFARALAAPGVVAHADRVRLGQLATPSIESRNLWAGASVAESGAAINPDGTVSIPANALCQIQAPDFADTLPIGAEVTAIVRLSSDLVKQVYFRPQGLETGTANLKLEPLAEGNLWIWRGALPAIAGATAVNGGYFQIDNRNPGKGYVAAPMTVLEFAIFEGTDIPSQIAQPLSGQLYGDDEVTIQQQANRAVITQQVDPALYWRATMDYTIDAGERREGWRITDMQVATRTGDFAFGNIIDGIDEGEVEVAIREDGKNDFMGGDAHKDHRQTRPLQSIIGGTYGTLDGATNSRERSIELIQHAQLFEEGNVADVVRATIRTSWLFAAGELILDNWVRIESDFTSVSFYLAMAPTLRAVFGTVLRAPEFAEVDVSADGHGQLFDNSGQSFRTIAVGAGGMMLEMECLHSSTGECHTLIADTPGRHKLYHAPFPIGPATNHVAGDIVRMVTRYRVRA